VINIKLKTLFIISILWVGVIDCYYNSNYITQSSIESFQHGILIDVEDGYPETTIAWSRVDSAFQLHSNLKYNYGSYKMAVLDTGFDEPTWTHFAGIIPYYKLDLHLIDADGNSVDRSFAYDMYEDVHHGTALMSLIFRCWKDKQIMYTQVFTCLFVQRILMVP